MRDTLRGAGRGRKRKVPAAVALGYRRSRSKARTSTQLADLAVPARLGADTNGYWPVSEWFSGEGRRPLTSDPLLMAARSPEAGGRGAVAVPPHGALGVNARGPGQQTSGDSSPADRAEVGGAGGRGIPLRRKRVGPELWRIPAPCRRVNRAGFRVDGPMGRLAAFASYAERGGISVGRGRHATTVSGRTARRRG